MPPDEAKRIKSEFDAIVDSQKPFSKIEIVTLHKDGRLIVLETSGVPIFGSDGRLHGYRGIDRDITEENKLRQESQYRLQQVIQADKLASLGEVVAGVAHEINNPNSFITYNIPLLEETWQIFEPLVTDYASAHPERRMSGFSIEELCGDMQELIRDIKTGSDRINKIVSNLKDFARLDESTQIKPVDVNEMIEKTMAIVGAHVRKSVGSVKMDLDPNLPKIQGHFRKLEQIMVNLMMNAVHAISDKDKGKLSVTTRYVGRLGSVLIEVEDNGIGMENGVIERIFEPFFTTRRDAGGTGLGLSVSYGLIQEHSGAIGVLSRPGLGTRFTLYLPVDGKKKLDLRPSILCLDDDVEFLELLNMHFVGVKNMSIKSKNKPESVVEYLENHPEVDIVLLDVMMSAKDGWELFEKIKARFPLLTVILYSHNLKAFKQKPDSAPEPDYFLEKPFKMEHLVEIINTNGRQRL
jgi:signal transduction histidine kinase/CheY-like chemotaxis protein